MHFSPSSSQNRILGQLTNMEFENAVAGVDKESAIFQNILCHFWQLRQTKFSPSVSPTSHFIINVSVCKFSNKICYIWNINLSHNFKNANFLHWSTIVSPPNKQESPASKDKSDKNLFSDAKNSPLNGWICKVFH